LTQLSSLSTSGKVIDEIKRECTRQPLHIMGSQCRIWAVGNAAWWRTLHSARTLRWTIDWLLLMCTKH